MNLPEWSDSVYCASPPEEAVVLKGVADIDFS